MRPPSCGSKVTLTPGSAETECPCGHHRVVCSAHRENARAGSQATVNSSSSGSIPKWGFAGGGSPPVVVGQQFEARGGVTPHLLEVGLHGLDALVVQAIEPAGALRAVGDQARVLEQLEVSRHRGAADGELVGELAYRAVTGSEQLDDRPPVRVTEGIERIAGQRVQRDCSTVAKLLPSPR